MHVLQLCGAIWRYGCEVRSGNNTVISGTCEGSETVFLFSYNKASIVSDCIKTKINKEGRPLEKSRF